MSTDTKRRIVDTAERLFAERGFSATSVRGITADAGVNLAALHYHFGSKENLIEEVFVRRLRPLNEERIQMLEKAEEEADHPLDIEAILRAFVTPPLKLLEDPRHGGRIFMMLMGRTFSEPGHFFRDHVAKHFSPIVEAYTSAFKKAVPELTDEEIFWRLQFTIGVMAHTMAHTINLLQETEDGNSWPTFRPTNRIRIEDLVDRIVTFCSSGFAADGAKESPNE